jgi:predicted CoA-substrate-specific enzyme activase
MANEYYLGLDLGSVSLDGIVLDGSGRVLWHSYRKVQGRSRDAVVTLCRELLREWLEPHEVQGFSGAMATGSGKEIVSQLLGVAMVNEIVAHGAAAARFARTPASVIEIGGQDSKFIVIDDRGACDYAMNELCAAGTGAFLDVQAERLGLSIEQLSEMAAVAEDIPTLAGRCSVFAKSDIIHLQQRGVPVDRIVAGLCYALARNYVATLIRGRELIRPVIFQGGVALNNGVLRAFKEILHLADQDALRPPLPHLAGAMGAALLAREGGSGLSRARVGEIGRGSLQARLARPIATGGWQLDTVAARQLQALESFEQTGAIPRGAKVVLALDIGSISTKAVLLSSDGALLAKSYLLTAGRPLEAARRALAPMAGLIGDEDIMAVGVTGSGRKLVGHALRADLIIDEITAQARGAVYGCRMADTVIEIGGQDAKFIRIAADSGVADFDMNRVCSAGTGSFIQEQAARLNIGLSEEFADLALSSTDPLPFTSRCTVFMGSDLVHYMQQGVAMADLLMGVCQAVVENYLSRVVQGREIGRRVVLQGGVAMNRAVVQAFVARLKGTEVVVHPQPGLSGAIGMALLTLERCRQAASAGTPLTSSHQVLSFPIEHRFSAFVCTACENRCEVGVFHFGESRFHFGDLCGRYSEALSGLDPGRDLTPDLAGLVGQEDEEERPQATIAIPRALLFTEFFPFWHAFFNRLAIRTVVSGPSNSGKLAEALTRLPAETCLPVKLLFGHVAHLRHEGRQRIFIPSTARLADGRNCLYVQHAAAMVGCNFDGLDIISLPLVPGLPVREKERLAEKAAALFTLDRMEVVRAYEAAEEELAHFRQTIRFGEAGLSPRKRPLAVLLGKPYNTGDPFVNMALAAKLAKAGFDVITGEQLAVPAALALPERYDSLTWTFGRQMLKTAITMTGLADLYPVVVGNFGCGPDAFTFPLLQELFAERPSLILEFDEHRADAGLVTRVEAFAQRVANWRRQARQRRPADKGLARPTRPPPTAADAGEYIIPNFSDHAYAFHGAFAAMGAKSRVLPLPDHLSYENGVEFSGGKQCHPFQLIAGDLIKLARSGELPQGAQYLVPFTESSCLISQYAPTIQTYMERLGRSDVTVLSPNSLEFLHRFGPLFWFNLGKVLLGIEYLCRLRLERRSYEVGTGTVDRAYQEGLRIIYQAQLSGRINQGIREAARHLDAVATRAWGGKPVIAVTGDVYTRVNPVANAGLFDLLEELGCEVWPSPTMVDIVMAGQEIHTRQCWEAGRTLDLMSSWGHVLVNNLGAGYVMKHFEGRLANLTEPSGGEVLSFTDGVLAGEPELLVALNVAKHVDFARKGVDGILNVYCLNCLVGTVTTAVSKRLSEQISGLPMMSLVFEAMGATHARNRVEAFVHRVKRSRDQRLGAVTK